jgi:hypothetical protein
MVLGTVKSRNNVLVRLTFERWNHIITSHLEVESKKYKRVLMAIKNPDLILKGDTKELLAVKKEPVRRQ